MFVSTNKGEIENPVGMFFSLALGYMAGSIYVPIIFNKLKEDYKKSLLFISFGFLIWGIVNLFYFASTASLTDTTNDDSYSFIPDMPIFSSYSLLLVFTFIGGMSLAAL